MQLLVSVVNDTNAMRHCGNKNGSELECFHCKLHGANGGAARASRLTPGIRRLMKPTIVGTEVYLIRGLNAVALAEYNGVWGHKVPIINVLRYVWESKWRGRCGTADSEPLELPWESSNR